MSFGNEIPLKKNNYTVIAQNLMEVNDIENAPSVSMGPYLLASEQLGLLNTISVYANRGDSREQVRLLYMNAPALSIWREMGKRPTILGARHRPPANAMQVYGVPFSE